MAFEWAYDLNGAKTPLKEVLPVSGDVYTGSMVGNVVGQGVASGTSGMGAGVAIKDYAWEWEEATPAIADKFVPVLTSETAVYRTKGAVVTATGGSSTTISTSLSGPDGVWKGGAVEVISCASNPALKGAKLPVLSDASGVLTVPDQVTAFAAGDTFYVVPGHSAKNYDGWGADATFQNVDFTVSDLGILKFVTGDYNNVESYFLLGRMFWQDT